MTPDEYWQNKTAPAGSTLYYSFLFLPADRRQAATALYALYHELDGIADGDPVIAPVRIAWWQTEIQAMFAGRAQHPISRALAQAVARYRLPPDGFEALLAGAESDVAKTRFADYPALRGYCRLVGGALAALAAVVFGHRDPSNLDHALALGIALQLADIVVGVGDDAARGRLYLPTTELAEFGVRIGDVFHRNNTDNFEHMMRFQIARVREALQQGLAQIPVVDRESQRPTLIRAALAAALLTEIARRPGAVLRERVALTPLRKLWIAWKTRAPPP